MAEVSAPKKTTSALINAAASPDCGIFECHSIGLDPDGTFDSIGPYLLEHLGHLGGPIVVVECSSAQVYPARAGSTL